MRCRIRWLPVLLGRLESLQVRSLQVRRLGNFSAYDFYGSSLGNWGPEC